MDTVKRVRKVALNGAEEISMKQTGVLIAALVALTLPAWAESDKTAEQPSDTEEVDLAAAEKIFQKSCRACHGNKGQGAASYPPIADKEPEYITEMLERYRSGEKIGPNSILMIQHAKKLSDEDIANLSVYVTTAFE